MFINKNGFLVKCNVIKGGRRIVVFDFEENEEILNYVHPCNIIHCDIYGFLLLIVDENNPKELQLFQSDRNVSNLIEESEEEEEGEEEEEDSTAVNQNEFKLLMKCEIDFTDPQSLQKIKILDENGRLFLTSTENDLFLSILEEQDGEDQKIWKYRTIKIEPSENQNSQTTPKFSSSSFDISPRSRRFVCSYYEKSATRLVVYSVKETTSEIEVLLNKRFEYTYFGGNYLSSGIGKLLLSKDGNKLIAGSLDGCYFYFFEFDNENNKFKMSKYPFFRGLSTTNIRSLSFSKSETFFAVLSDRPTVHIFSLTQANKNPNEFLGGRFKKSYRALSTYSIPKNDDFQECIFMDREDDICLIGDEKTVFIEFNQSFGGEAGVCTSKYLIHRKKGIIRLNLKKTSFRECKNYTGCQIIHSDEKPEKENNHEAELVSDFRYKYKKKQKPEGKLSEEEDYYFLVELNNKIVKRTPPAAGNIVGKYLEEERFTFDITVNPDTIEGSILRIKLCRCRSRKIIFDFVFAIPKYLWSKYQFNIIGCHQTYKHENIMKGPVHFAASGVFFALSLFALPVYFLYSVGHEDEGDGIVDVGLKMPVHMVAKTGRRYSLFITTLGLRALDFGRTPDEVYRMLFTSEFQFADILSHIFSFHVSFGLIDKKDRNQRKNLLLVSKHFARTLNSFVEDFEKKNKINWWEEILSKK